MTNNRIAVTECECAQAIGMSVPWLRKDRQSKRIIPFYRIGTSVRYNLDRVAEALANVEEGGRPKKAGKRAGASA